MTDLDSIQQVLGLHRQGRAAEAEAGYRQLLAARPQDAQLWHLLGTLLAQGGRWGEAAEALQRTLELQPAHVEAMGMLARVREQLEEPDAAEALWRNLAARQPESPQPWLGLGGMWASSGQRERALAVYDERLSTHPGELPIVIAKGKALNATGRYRESFDLLAPLVEAGERNPEVARLYADACQQLDQAEAGLAHAQRVLADPALPERARKRLEFAAGRMADGLKQWDQAFAHFERANLLAAGRGQRDGQLEIMRRTLAWWGRERHASLPASGIDADLPVFIVGMPRSGTSLTEQILDSHPLAHGAGELNAVADIARGLVEATGTPYPECLAEVSGEQLRRAAEGHLAALRARAPEARRVTDKMPHNFIYLGLIARLFPGARIIHCRRNPVDTCLSEYFQNFGEVLSFTADLRALGRHYGGYRQLMAHWEAVLELPVMTVDYEQLVADQEAVSRAVLEFLDLPWDDACLAFHRNRRVVETASMHQVKSPVYKRSVARWRHYEAHLGPLLETLAAEGVAVDG